jgi:hypothetical protein
MIRQDYKDVKDVKLRVGTVRKSTDTMLQR